MTSIFTQASVYLKETETATQQLFLALEHYRELLKNIKRPALFRDVKPFDNREAIFNQWYEQNEAEINAAREREQKYMAQWFSESTIAGAILQIAYMGIRLHVRPHPIPNEFKSVKFNEEAEHFCIGKLIRGVQQGLIIYAGRIQYNHLNADKLHPVPKRVFELLSQNHGWPVQNYKDPAYDLEQGYLENYAANILYLMKWSSYTKYEIDMRKMLNL